MKVRTLLQGLYQHYITPPEEVFPQFKMGVSLFLLGMIVMYFAYQFLEPSLHQELTTLAGIIIIAIGFLTSMMAQVRMVIGRFLRFFFEG